MTEAVKEQYLLPRTMGHLLPGMYDGVSIRRIVGMELFQTMVNEGTLELVPDWSKKGECR